MKPIKIVWDNTLLILLALYIIGCSLLVQIHLGYFYLISIFFGYYLNYYLNKFYVKIDQKPLKPIKEDEKPSLTEEKPPSNDSKHNIDEVKPLEKPIIEPPISDIDKTIDDIRKHLESLR